MLRKRAIPGADKVEELVQATEQNWRGKHSKFSAEAIGLFTRIFILARLESNFYDHILRDTERNATEHYLLSMIRTFGPQSPTQLNVALIQTTGGVTNTLTRLEKAELITRVRPAGDRRAVEVRLTAKGRKEADRSIAIVGEAIQAKADKLNPQQREQVNKALDMLIKTLLS
jgi:DNA-binding MarR family transcriptional regulator